jgi:DNA invertase Pin-like site-specific DNA recombinase
MEVIEKMKDERQVGIYARVSTRKGQDPRMQVIELRSYCKRRGWSIVDEYVDHGVSGAKDSRPELDRLMRDCQKRVVSAVIVYRYDRFARSLRHLVNALSEFNSLGIDFISLHEGVDTTTPNGRLVFGIFASISEFERELIGQRIRSGLDAARARGQKLGRAPIFKLTAEQCGQLKSEHRLRKASLRTLAQKYKVSVWRAFALCSGQKARV